MRGFRNAMGKTNYITGKLFNRAFYRLEFRFDHPLIFPTRVLALAILENSQCPFLNSDELLLEGGTW